METAEKIRVALVAPYLVCGGMEMFIFRLGRYLARQGLEVEVLTVKAAGEWFDRLQEFGLKGEHIPQAEGVGRLRHCFNVGRRLAQGRYDVVILNNAEFAQASLRMLPDAVIVIPILHNHSYFAYQVGCANRKAWNVAVAVSPKVLQTAQALIPDRPIVEIPYGVELPEEALWKSRRPLESEVQLAFVGRLHHRQKGVFFLPEILKGCLELGIQAQLVIVGDGPDRDQLKKKFKELGLQEKVQFHPLLIGQEVYQVLLDSHLFVMPSFFEGLPIIALEAQACGCVPVASRLNGITDVAIEDGRTGLLVETGQVKQFCQAIFQLATNAHKWKQMSEAGHFHIAKSFSIPRMGSLYHELILAGLAGKYPLPYSRRMGLPIDPGLIWSSYLLHWSSYLPQWAKRSLRYLGERFRGLG